MALSEQFWKMAAHFKTVIESETGFPVVVYDNAGYIALATDQTRIGTLHPGALAILQGKTDEYAVTPEEAAANPLVREGYNCPIVIEGERVAAFGISGPLDQTKSLARVAVRLIDAWIADRKHLLQLERSERKYRSIFAHSSQGIFQSTLDGRFLTANQALAEIYGYPSPEVLLAEISDIVHQLYVNPMERRRLIDALQDQGRVTGFQTQLRRRDGQAMDVRINAHFVVDPDSGARLMEGLIEDVTANKRMEEALKRSEEKFYKAFNNSPIWIVLSSLQTGRYIEVNETFVRAIGYAREEIIGRTSLEIGSWVNPADRQHVLDTLKKTGAIQNFEVKRRTRAGRVLTMLLAAQVIDIAGEACMLTVSQDISRRQRMEAKLRLSENNLQITLDSIGDAVITTDTEGVITRMNPMAERLTGWAAAEALGRPLPEVFRIINAQTRQTVANPAAKVLASGALVGLANHTLLVARDGREFQIADSGAPIRDAKGRVVGVVLVFRDVSGPHQEYGLRFVSEKVTEIFGLEGSPESLFPAFTAGLPETEREAFLDSIRQAVRDVGPWHYQGRFNKTNGDTIWFSGNSIPHQEGRYLVFDGVLIDITAIKRAEAEIDERRQFLESVLYHAPDAIVTLDASHRVLDWNPGAVQIFGYTPAEAIGRQLDELVAPAEAFTEASHKTRQVLSGARVEAFETIRFHKDGSPRHVIAAGSPILVDGVLKGVVAVYTDITSRKQAEARFREAHERFLTVLESIDATIYVADMQTYEILYMNEQMKRVFGADFTGQICHRVFRHEPRQCAVCTNDRLVDADGNPTGVCVWESRNPVMNRWYVNYDRAIRWVDGRMVRLQVATDITDQKTMESERQNYEARIQQAQKMEAIGTLAGGIAHDFNNILSAVLGYAELALIDAANDPRLVGNIRQIHAAGTRARELVQQILTFSRQEEKALKPLQMGLQIKEALKMLRSSLPTTIEIVAHIAGKVDNVLADPTQIHQIVMNLCANAAQAMEEKGGVLTVGLTQEILTTEDARALGDLKAGDYARLTVQDTGGGIPADILDKIYQPYFTTKEKGKGTGLGLAVVHGIVQSYGGDIRVESVAGRGTTFHVYLPTIKAAADTSRRDVSMPLGRGERVLFVDDEAFIVDFGRQGLERLGYRVEGCRGSLEALELFRRAPDQYDLVITDMTMPKMTGDQLALEMLKLRPDLPIIISTGYSSRINPQQAQALGIRALLMKPLNLAELAHRVREAIDGAAPAQ
jgi:PAS domain S-box-containing protein